MFELIAGWAGDDSILSPLRVFQYITVRAGSALIFAFLFCIFFGDLLIRRLERLQAIQPIRVATGDGAKNLTENHQKKRVPTMGGLLMIGAVIAAALLFTDWSEPVLWLGVFGLLAFGFIGFMDDYLKVVRKKNGGLNTKQKLIFQIVFGSIFALLFVYGVPSVVSYQIDSTGEIINGADFVLLPFFKNALIPLGIGYIAFAIFVMTATTNAVNLTDGLDGLATGVTITVTICLALAAYLVGRIDASDYLIVPYVQGAGELSVLLAALIGACLGFLWFNSHPAQVFMGDTGSMALGGLLGATALLIKMEYLLVIAGGILVAEALSVIIQVASWKLRKKRVFAMSPLHHHFECIGWAESKIIARFWIVSALFALSSLMTLKFR